MKEFFKINLNILRKTQVIFLCFPSSYSFIHSFKYLLNIYYVLGDLLHAWSTIMSKDTDSCFCRFHNHVTAWHTFLHPIPISYEFAMLLENIQIFINNTKQNAMWVVSNEQSAMETVKKCTETQTTLYFIFPYLFDSKTQWFTLVFHLSSYSYILIQLDFPLRTFPVCGNWSLSTFSFYYAKCIYQSWCLKPTLGKLTGNT